MLGGKVNIRKVDERAVIPTYSTKMSAGADLYAIVDDDVIISPGETAFIRTGLAVQIPEGYAGMIFARSGLACKKGLAPANKVGVVDADYRGEVMVAIHNHSLEDRVIGYGERIAQLVILPFFHAEFNEVSELDDTIRGEGGFGSTGMK